jgi:hypothetical protein
MKNRRSLQLRMAADMVLVGVFGFVVPPFIVPIARNLSLFLAPIGKNLSITLTSIVGFLIAGWFWYDFLRTLQRLRKSDTDRFISPQ